MKNEIVTACYQLITAGINGTVQGIMVALLVAGGLRLMGRTNAATRHAVWFATLLLLALIIPANLLHEHLESAHSSTVVQEADSSAPDPISAEATHAAATPQDGGYSAEAPPQNLTYHPGHSGEELYAILGLVCRDDQNTGSEAPARLSVLEAVDAAVVNQAEA